MPKTIGFGDFLHVRTGIGDSDEALACFGGAHCFFHALVEILFEDVWFEGAAGFAGNDENRFGDVYVLFNRANLCGIGGIEDVELRMARNIPVGLLENFDTEAGTAHAQEHSVLKSSLVNFVGNLLELAFVRNLIVGNGQPAKPLVFVLVGPQRRVARPQALYFLPRFPVFKVFFYGLV